MVLKTSSHTKSLDFLQAAQASNSPSHKQQNFFKNNQKWQISRQLDCESGSPTFHLIDPFGQSVTTTEFIVENIDACFRQALLQSKTPEEQQRFLYDYLQRQLAQATPYKVHIEHYENKAVVRFGDYGLKGGGRLFETFLACAPKAGERPLNFLMAIVFAIALGLFSRNKDRNSAWRFSWITSLSGIYLFTTQGNPFARLVGTCLTSAGISGGNYAYSNNNASYKAEKFVQQSVYGGLAGLISGGFGTLAQGSGFLTTIGSQVLGGAAGNGIVAALESSGETRQKEVVNKTIAGALGSGASSAIGMATHHIMNQTRGIQSAIESWAVLKSRSLGADTFDSLLWPVFVTIGFIIFKKFAQGGLTAMSSRIVTNFYERRHWNYHLQESTVVGAATGTALGVGEVVNGFYMVYERDALLELRDPERERGANNDVLEIKLNQRIQQGERASQLNESSMKQNFLVLSERDIIKKALSTKPVSYIDCDRNELISHVILVQALSSESGSRYYENEFDWAEDIRNSDYSTLFTFRKLITPNGTIGHHLDMEKRQYAEGFLTRPQTHWAWNQLVQPHGKGNWEKDKIAVFEPLSEFENSSFKPYAVAPYDTQSFMPIHLSKRSIIIVPNSMLGQVRDHLTNFRGQVVGYDPSKNLRTAILDTLSDRYPEAWHVCDEKGNLIGHQAHETPGGYETKTCLKTSDGQIHILFHNSGKHPSDQHSQAMKEYRTETRFIGLHNESTTYWLESRPYFMSLKEVTLKNIEFLKKCPLFFAANVKEVCSLSRDRVSEVLKPYVGLITVDQDRRASFIQTLNELKTDAYSAGVLEAFHFYQTLVGESTAQTGSYSTADYVLKEAIFADIMSLFFNTSSGENFTLSVPELQLIIEPIFPMLKKLIKQTKSHVDNKANKEASETFNQYRVLLQECLSDAVRAKIETVDALKKVGNNSSSSLEIDFASAESAWNDVPLPQHIEFDLKSNWPFPPKLEAYVEKIMTLLPTELDQLQQLYYNLRSAYQGLNGTDVKREQYWLNVLSTLTQYQHQAKLYLRKRNMNDNRAILLDLLTRHASWLQNHHLQIYDATKRIGDCLFDNIIAQARDISSKTADELRKALIEFMRTNPKEFHNKPDYKEKNWLEVAEGGDGYIFTDWNSYLTCLGTSQVWATELEVHALSILLERPIVLISAKAKPKIYNPEGRNTPIFLNHKNENHFESCRPVGLQSHEIYQKILQEPHY